METQCPFTMNQNNEKTHFPEPIKVMRRMHDQHSKLKPLEMGTQVYHVVWIPKCLRKVLYGQLRNNLREVFHELSRQKEIKVFERNLLPDHVHVLLSIPPKYSVVQVVGYMMGKSAIHIARTYIRPCKNRISD